MFRNCKSACLFVLLFLGLCLSLPVPLYADGSDSVFLEHSREWYTTDNTYVEGVSAGDIDQDGTTEIITVGRYETGATSYGGEYVRHGQIRIWNWNGTTLELEHTENWTAPAIGTGWWRGIQAVAIDDADSDGTKEIVTAGYLWENISVGPWMGCYEGELAIWNWTGSVLEQEHVEKWYTSKDTLANDVCVHDVDDDGAKEIITCGTWVENTTLTTYAQLRIWNWTGTVLTLERSEEWTASVPVYAYSVFAEDVDQDGDVEIITGGWKRNGSYYTSQVRIWNWNGKNLTLEHNEEWGEFTSTGRSAVYAVFAKDLNNDSVTEIVSAGYAYTPAQAQVIIWNWNGTVFASKYNEEWNSTHGVNARSLYAADVNADGITELVSVGYVNNDTYYQGQLRTWHWNGTSLIPTGKEEWGDEDTRGIDVFVSDLDGDHLKEVITGGYTRYGTFWHGQLGIWSSDTTPPDITDVSQTPRGDNVLPEDEVKINATVTDDLSGVKQVILNYTNGNGTWITVDMTNLEGNVWSATIPAFPYCTNVTYVIIAEDNANNPITTEQLEYEYQYHVIPEFPSAIILPLFMFLALIAAALAKKIRCKAMAKTT